MGADYRQSRPPMRGCAGGEMAKRRHFADRPAKKIEEFDNLDVQTSNLSRYRGTESLDAECADESEERGLERFQVLQFLPTKGRIRKNPRWSASNAAGRHAMAQQCGREEHGSRQYRSLADSSQTA
jgi:hypothetical protein